jgi:nitrogen-specific signal transduction histidine kinase
MQGNGFSIPADMQSRFSQPFCSSKINNKNAGLSFSIYQQVTHDYRRPFSLLQNPVVPASLQASG